MSKSSVRTALLWLSLVAMFIAACAPVPVEAPVAPAASGDSAAAAPAAADGETEFVFAHTGPIRTMDAPVTWFGSTHWLTNLLYDCLIWRSVDGSGYVGQAAESWENIDDVTWRFHLREGNTFHNGEPLDANAVKWNLDRVRTREDFMVQPQWVFIEDVVVVDDWTVDVITDGPHAYFEYDMSYNGCELLPPGYMEEVGEEEFARTPVGSGPYKLAEFTESDRYVFEAWDDYWEGRPEVDRVVYQVIPEASSQVAALLAGQVDMIANVPVPDREMVASSEGLETVRITSNRIHNIYLRNETASGTMDETYPGFEPATLDQNIRQAISHALDRTLLAEVQGAADPRLLRVCSYYPEGFPEEYAGAEVADAWYDPELAKELIVAAGYDPDNGNKPTLYFDAPALQAGNEKEVAEVAATMLEDVGFEVELNILENAAFNEQISTPGNNRDMMLTTLGCAPSLVPLFYTCDWQQSNYNVCVPEWDALGKQILSTVDPDERLALWDQWWEYYMDYAPTMSLYEIDNVIGMSDDFEWPVRSDGWFTFRGLKARE